MGRLGLGEGAEEEEEEAASGSKASKAGAVHPGPLSRTITFNSVLHPISHPSLYHKFTSSPITSTAPTAPFTFGSSLPPSVLRQVNLSVCPVLLVGLSVYNFTSPGGWIVEAAGPAVGCTIY